MRMGRDDRDEVLDFFTEEVNDLMEMNSLILNLGDKAMKKRHWNKVFNLLNEKNCALFLK